MDFFDYLVLALGIYSAIFIGILKIGFNTKKIQRLENLVGEVPTRLIHILIGAFLIYLSLT